MQAYLEWKETETEPQSVVFNAFRILGIPTEDTQNTRDSGIQRLGKLGDAQITATPPNLKGYTCH